MLTKYVLKSSQEDSKIVTSFKWTYMCDVGHGQWEIERVSMHWHIVACLMPWRDNEEVLYATQSFNGS